jgi:hypothetical protein
MKVTLYIDGEHNTVEVKDKIKSVLPDANYMIFDHTENKGKVTEFDRIKNMNVQELAEWLAISNLRHCEKDFLECRKSNCVKCQREWLESEVETND